MEYSQIGMLRTNLCDAAKGFLIGLAFATTGDCYRRIGRKKANLITAALFLLGSVCMTFCGSVATLLLGRFIAGVAVGSSGPCVSVYVAEIAHPDIRGTLVTINEVREIASC